MATIYKRANRPRPWRAQVLTPDGRRLSKSFLHKRHAEQWTRQQEVKISEEGANLAAISKRHTVRDAIARYRETILPTKRSSTIPTQDSQLIWWDERLGRLALGDVTPARIVMCRDELSDTKSNATVVRYLAAFSHVFSVAIKQWQWCSSNPLKQVEKPKESQGRMRYLTQEERERLLDVCKESRSKYLYLVVNMALYTGARKSEILGLCWGDIDFTNELIHFTKTKNGERRSIPLVEPLLSTLRQYGKVRRIDTDLLYPNDAGTAPENPRTAWEVSVKYAGLKDFKFHDLRHSCASVLVQAGVALPIVGAILGHKSHKMTLRYSHLAPEHLREAMQRMAARR